MKFAHPEILWALGALAIPIIVHLFNFRRFKRIAFSNVAFLKEVQLQTKSRNKLRHLLILLARLLAIAFLVMAFAQPFIPLDEEQSGSNVRSVSLYIDNSFSMEALSSDGPLLDLAKARAAEVVSAFQPTDRFNIITNDLEGRHQRFFSQEDALDLIAEIEPSPAARPLSELLERQQDLLLRDGEGDASIFVFSDLQKNTHRATAFKPDSSIAVRFIPDLASRSENLYIDSVWFDTPVRLPGQPEILRIRIRNTAESGKDNVPMRLDINGRQLAIGSFNVIPGTYTDTALYFTTETPGFKHAKVSIQDHPVVYDDDWYFSYHVASQLNVLRISENLNDRTFKNIFGNDPFYSLTQVDVRNVNYGQLQSYDLIILDQVNLIPTGLTRELSEFMQAGSTVLFIPSESGDVNSWNELLLAGGAPSITGKQKQATRVANINLNHMLYRGVFERIPENIDLPSVQEFYTFDRSARSGEETLMELQNRQPFFFVAKAGSGKLFAATSSLQAASGNFAQHALFVPTMLRVAELSRPVGRMDAAIGEDAILTINGLSLPGDASFRMSKVNTQDTFIPRHRTVRGAVEVFVGEERTAAGNYEIAVGDSVVSATGMNYSRSESVLAAWDIPEWETELSNAGWYRFSIVQADLETISKTIEELDEGRKLWDLFLIIALSLLLIEIILIKIPNT